MTDWTPCHRVDPHPMHANDLYTGRGCPGVHAEVGPAERLAQRFHETYERLAPSHGYETREASAKPWADVPEPNRSLMIEVAAELLATWPAAEAGRADDDGGDVREAAALRFVNTLCDARPGAQTYLALLGEEALHAALTATWNAIRKPLVAALARTSADRNEYRRERDQAQRELAEVTRERDKARADLATADELAATLAQADDTMRAALDEARAKAATATSYAEMLEAASEKLAFQRAEALDVLHKFADPDPCRFDHNGYCQAHFLDPAPCPVAEANRLNRSGEPVTDDGAEP